MLQNPRFAAIFAQCVERDLPIESRYRAFAVTGVNANATTQYFRDQISSWARYSQKEFAKLNGLLGLNDPTSEVIKALEWVISGTPNRMPDPWWKWFGVELGIMTCHEKEVVVGETKVTVSRYLMTEATVAMTLDNFGVVSAPATGEGFEQTVADFVALCLQMPQRATSSSEHVPQIDQHKASPFRVLLSDFGTLEWVSRVPPFGTKIEPSATLVGLTTEQLREFDQKTTTNGKKTFKTAMSAAEIDQKILATARNVCKRKFFPTVRTWVSQQKRGVVITNQPLSSYADIIALTPKKLFLIQCKRYASNTPVGESLVEKEFAKMGSPAFTDMDNTDDAAKNWCNQVLTETLRLCCGPDATVHFVLVADAPNNQTTDENFVDKNTVSGWWRLPASDNTHTCAMPSNKDGCHYFFDVTTDDCEDSLLYPIAQHANSLPKQPVAKDAAEEIGNVQFLSKVPKREMATKNQSGVGHKQNTKQ